MDGFGIWFLMMLELYFGCGYKLFLDNVGTSFEYIDELMLTTAGEDESKVWRGRWMQQF